MTCGFWLDRSPSHERNGPFLVFLLSGLVLVASTFLKLNDGSVIVGEEIRPVRSRTQGGVGPVSQGRTDPVCRANPMDWLAFRRDSLEFRMSDSPSFPDFREFGVIS